jgi:hypothetical protein
MILLWIESGFTYIVLCLCFNTIQTRHATYVPIIFNMTYLPIFNYYLAYIYASKVIMSLKPK